MSDIREAVASAICESMPCDCMQGLRQCDRLADAALAVARPLIEAEARERALREVLDLREPDKPYIYMQDIAALLPAPAEEADRACDDT